MKKYLTAILILLCVSFFAFPGAVLKFKTTTVDFGKVDEDKKAEFNYEFENAGDSLLVIEKVQPGCGCTTAGLEKKEYKPGEKGVIPIKFDAHGYSGRVTKNIRVTSNDSQHPSLQLKLTGEVVLKNFSYPQMEEENIDFGDIKIGKEYTRELVITNIGNVDLEMIEMFHSPQIVPELEDILV